MKESLDEGLANHIGPESSAVIGNGISEALTGESAGWVLSLVRDLDPSADVWASAKQKRKLFCEGEVFFLLTGPLIGDPLPTRVGQIPMLHRLFSQRVYLLQIINGKFILKPSSAS